jgi:hypothetical protein
MMAITTNNSMSVNPALELTLVLRGMEDPSLWEAERTNMDDSIL